MENKEQTGSERENGHIGGHIENSTDADGDDTTIKRDEDNTETQTADLRSEQENVVSDKVNIENTNEDDTKTQIADLRFEEKNVVSDKVNIENTNGNKIKTQIADPRSEQENVVRDKVNIENTNEDDTKTQTADLRFEEKNVVSDKGNKENADEDDTKTQTVDLRSEQENVVSDKGNKENTDEDDTKTQTVDLRSQQENVDCTNINLENRDENKNISDSSLRNIQDNNTLGEGETAKKNEQKKRATFSEEAPTITITGEDSSPDSSEEISISDKLEVNNNTEKPLTEENENKGRCPIYFGIKSYLHQFYAPPDKEVLNSGEYIQEDDFEFVVEPGKRRWRGFWFRVGMWVGINLILLGLIALLVGYLTPPRQTVVGRKENLEILDRWAIAFNRRLEICRFAGLCVFCCGAVIVMLTLLVSSYQQEPTYYVVGAAVVPEIFVGNPLIGQQQRWNNAAACRIPLTGTIRNIQPSILSNN